jgi:tetratricopeptide (TPR) repeat protein
VQIYDTGTIDGLPYFAMELVEGTNLKERIDGTPQNPRAAAHLTELLARAIHTAHLQGIVHRDLKPANVLLIDDGRAPNDQPESALLRYTPKISDFGLAKRLDQDSGLTQSGALAGTPGFMAPEQAQGKSDAIGARTDVYALGAILYNLITGRPPFLADTSIQIIQQVLEQDPVSPRSLNPNVSRDLETICLKCLEKEPSRRYASAQAFAEDLERYLRGEPIQARKVGALGKTWRWSKRNPQLAAVSVTLLLVLIAAVVAGPIVAYAYRDMAQDALQAQEDAEAAEQREKIEANRAKALQQQAEQEAALSKEVSHFLLGLFDDADPLAWSGRAFGVLPETNPTALEIVERGARHLADKDELKDRPLVRANFLEKIGNVYVSLGRTDKAQPMLTEALALRREHLRAPHEDLAASLNSVGYLHFASGDLAKSAAYIQQALDMRRELLGKEHPHSLESMVQLGVVYLAASRGPEGEPLLQKALEAYRRRRLTRSDPAQPMSPAAAQRDTQWMFIGLAALAYHHVQAKNVADKLKAAPLVAELQELAGALPHQEMGQVVVHFLDAEKLHYAGNAISNLSKPAAQDFHQQAEAKFLLAIQTAERVCKKDHYMLAWMRRDYGHFLADKQRFQEAERELAEAVRVYRLQFGNRVNRELSHLIYHHARTIFYGRLRNAKTGEEKLRIRAEAEKLAREAVTIDRAISEVNPQSRALHEYFLAVLLLNASPPRYADAEEHLRSVWGLRRKMFDDGDPNVLEPASQLVNTLVQQRKYEEAEAVFREITKPAAVRKWSPAHGTRMVRTAKVCAVNDKVDLAMSLLTEAVAAGFRDRQQLENAVEFQSLRGRADFKSLMQLVQSKSQP